jgi:large subunit ribosomal protein LP1
VPTSLTLAAQADKISTILKAAGVEVESYWPGLFAKTLAAQKLDSLITNIGSGAPQRRVPTRRRAPVQP